MKTLHIEVEVDEYGNITYRDHTADKMTMTDRCTPLDVGLEIAGLVLKSMGALSKDANTSI